jgi:hypothetical protein
MFQTGAAAATLEVNIIAKEGLDKVAAILRIKAFYKLAYCCLKKSKL